MPGRKHTTFCASPSVLSRPASPGLGYRNKSSTVKKKGCPTDSPSWTYGPGGPDLPSRNFDENRVGVEHQVGPGLDIGGQDAAQGQDEQQDQDIELSLTRLFQ